VVILVVDAQQGIGEHDSNLAAHIVESGRALVVAVNKWDGLDDGQRDAIKDALAQLIERVTLTPEGKARITYRMGSGA
jgi:GTP-binding protein